MEIGTGTMIGTGTTLSAGFAPGQNLGDRCIVRIGDRVVLGRGSHVVGHSSIDIGDDVYTGPYVYITDQNHTYADPDIPIGRQWPTNQPVRIGAGSWLGTGVVVLPGADIGRNVVVAAGYQERAGTRIAWVGVRLSIVKPSSTRISRNAVSASRRKVSWASAIGTPAVYRPLADPNGWRVQGSTSGTVSHEDDTTCLRSRHRRQSGLAPGAGCSFRSPSARSSR